MTWPDGYSISGFCGKSGNGALSGTIMYYLQPTISNTKLIEVPAYPFNITPVGNVVDIQLSTHKFVLQQIAVSNKGALPTPKDVM